MATVAESLAELVKTEGALAAALVDSNSGMMLGSAGFGLDIELAAAGNTEVLRSKLKTIKNLGMDDTIEDILITLGKQYHVLRPLKKKSGIFVYVVLDRSRANLALARRACQDAEENLEI
jgi:predicted regulator of Ras-like GTPase activity (Roadblock/LC7/MglB family)